MSPEVAKWFSELSVIDAVKLLVGFCLFGWVVAATEVVFEKWVAQNWRWSEAEREKNHKQ